MAIGDYDADGRPDTYTGESLTAQLRPWVEQANNNPDTVRKARTAYKVPARAEAL